jgi:hypothetical protein
VKFCEKIDIDVNFNRNDYLEELERKFNIEIDTSPIGVFTYNKRMLCVDLTFTLFEIDKIKNIIAYSI